MTSNTNASTSPNHHEWTKLELTNFFTLFKKYPYQFDIISQNLPGITPVQVKSLYMDHKTLLSLDNISLEIFLASYADKSSSSIYQPTVKNGGGDLINISMDQHISSVGSNDNSSINNIQNSPKTPLSKRSLLNGRRNEERSPVDDDSIYEVASELLHLKNTPTPLTNKKFSSNPAPSISPLKSSFSQTNASSEVLTPNKKSQSSSSSSRPNNASILKKRLEKMLGNEKFRKWCIYEWFYSDIDQTWFNTNEFQGCLNAIMHHKEKKVATRKEWSCIRAMIGKPRRMSKAFLDAERQKLVNHRINIRLSREGKPTIGGGIDSEKFAKLSKSTIIEPGEKCLFISKDFEVLIGKVLSRSPEYHYEIEYTDSNGHINVVNVLDENVMSYGRDDDKNMNKKRNFEVATPNRVVITPYKRPKRSSNDSPLNRSLRENINNSIPIINEDDIACLNRFEALLNEKKNLLNELKSMNDEAELIKSSGEKQLSERFRHQYASTIINLDKKNEEIEKCLNTIKSKINNHVQVELFTQENDGSVYFYNWYMEMMKQCNTIAKNIVSSAKINNNNDENNNNNNNNDKIEQEKANVFQMVTNAISLCVHFIQCKELNLSEDEVSVALDAAATVLRPLYEDNLELYKKILNQMKLLKEELLSDNR